MDRPDVRWRTTDPPQHLGVDTDQRRQRRIRGHVVAVGAFQRPQAGFVPDHEPGKSLHHALFETPEQTVPRHWSPNGVHITVPPLVSARVYAAVWSSRDSQGVGYSVPAVVTGKPLASGGSEGRSEATTVCGLCP